MGYDARQREVTDEIDASLMTDEEKRKMREAAIVYFQERNRCFENLRDLLHDDRPSIDQQRAWTERVDVCRGGLAITIGDALKTIAAPTNMAATERMLLMAAEDRFLTALRDVRAGEARDRLVELRRSLDKETADLTVTWKAMVAQDGTLLHVQEEQATAVTKLLDDTVRQIALENAEVGQGFALVVAEMVSSSGNVAKLIDLLAHTKLKDPLELAATSLKAMKANIDGRITVYGDFVKQLRETVLHMFNEVREDVKEFEEKNSYNVARDVFVAARERLGSFASSGTSGQASDASAFRDAAIDMLDDHFDKVKEIYDTFVRQNSGIFFGPISDETRKALLHGEWWVTETRRMISSELWARLRVWRRLPDSFFGADVSRLDDAVKRELHDRLDAQFREYVAAIEEASEQAEQIEEAFDREDLEDELD